MLGLATRILIARRTADAMRAAHAPESTVIDHHVKWYYLGALGPAIGDFVPTELGDSKVLGSSQRSPYYTVWQKILEIAVGSADGNTPGIVEVLDTFNSFLQRVTSLVKDHDFDGMIALRDSGELDVINEASAKLGKILAKFSDKAQLAELGDLFGFASQPKIIHQSIKYPPSRWTGREFLHWKRTGAFATELRRRADASGDPRFRAYAMGWSVSFAALVCGSGFMCSLVGAGYRNQWWRSRWIGQFVDTWCWGYYGDGATMSAADEPTPRYQDWRTCLCDAKLHDLIDVSEMTDANAINVAKAIVSDNPLPKVLPADFVTFWMDSWNATYPATGSPLFTADRLQAAYMLLWTTLWFQTSGKVIGCNPAPSDTPPDACGADPKPPEWVDPTQPNPADDNKPFKAPTPDAKHDPSIAEVVSGIVLAIAGVAACFLGGAAFGIPAIAGGIGLIVDGEKTLNWDELECNLYWLSVYLHTGIDELHKLAVFGGVQPPYPAELASPSQQIRFGTAELPYTAGAAVCKSRQMGGMHLPWNGNVTEWTFYPSNGIEPPATDVWSAAGLWPSAFIDDAAANPATADLRGPAKAWPGGIDGSFGPAVQASVALLRNPRPLPNWNLDGDRGKGWLTWELSSLYVPGEPVPAVPEA